MLIFSIDAYVLVDMSAMHAYISEQFMVVCGLIPEVLINYVCSVSTPLEVSSVLSKVCRNVEVLVSGMCLPIDMLVLSISDFNVVLGMNWLN